MVLRRYQHMYDAYFEERDLIPRIGCTNLRLKTSNTIPSARFARLMTIWGLADFDTLLPRLEGVRRVVGELPQERILQSPSRTPETDPDGLGEEVSRSGVTRRTDAGPLRQERRGLRTPPTSKPRSITV